MCIELVNGQQIRFSKKESDFILDMCKETGLCVHDLFLLSVLALDNAEYKKTDTLSFIQRKRNNSDIIINNKTDLI